MALLYFVFRVTNEKITCFGFEKVKLGGTDGIFPWNIYRVSQKNFKRLI